MSKADCTDERAGDEVDPEFARRLDDTVTRLAEFAGVPSANSRIQFMSALVEWWRWFAREAGGFRLDKVRIAAQRLAAKISRLKFDPQGKDAAAALEVHEAWGVGESGAAADAVLGTALAAEASKRGVPPETFKTNLLDALESIAEAATNAKESARGRPHQRGRRPGIKGYPTLHELVFQLEFSARIFGGGFRLSRKQGCSCPTN